MRRVKVKQLRKLAKKLVASTGATPGQPGYLGNGMFISGQGSERSIYKRLRRAYSRHQFSIKE